VRSGRVRVAAGTTKTIIYVPSGGGSSIRYYRVYNSGRDKNEAITIVGGANSADIPVLPHESIDFGVKNSDIQIRAGASEEADVVYDFLG